MPITPLVFLRVGCLRDEYKCCNRISECARPFKTYSSKFSLPFLMYSVLKIRGVDWVLGFIEEREPRRLFYKLFFFFRHAVSSYKCRNWKKVKRVEVALQGYLCALQLISFVLFDVCVFT